MSSGGPDLDPREEYLSLISLEKSHVNLTPPIVFLFGGALSCPSQPPQTVRGILYNHICCKHQSLFDRLVIPEEFTDWLHDSIYPDLLSFQSDLAQTSSLIIIALESPGSIAELGSFSVNTALKDKLIIIISAHHHNEDSFITLGPLRLLPEKNVYSYPYNHNSVGDSLDEFLDDIVNNINSSLCNIKKTERFDVENNGHVAMLIYELVFIFKALKINEIRKYLSKLSASIDLSHIKRLLFLLEKLSLINRKRLGNIDYYIPLKVEQRITFSSKNPSMLFNRTAASIVTAKYYESSNKEKMRKRVIDQLEVWRM